MLFALGLLSIGTALTRPPLFGLLSNLTPENEQGATIGVAQSVGSLARIVGPVFATALLPLRAALPYVICALILFATTWLLLERFAAKTTPGAPGFAPKR
jgi:MFS transporter, DHA1 family, tetracycline resistance protein